MAAISADSDENTYDQLISEYIGQKFEGKPTPNEISQVCSEYLSRLFPSERIQFALRNKKFQLNFTTTLLKKEVPSQRTTIGNIIVAAVLNSFDRRLLGMTFRRALFSVLPHPGNSPLAGPWDAIPSIQVNLDQRNFLQALLATGSIPTVLRGESSIPGSIPGHHLDGGLLDYHFEIESPGPIIYPHFSSDPIPGWLDRFPPFRRVSRAAREQLCVILPSRELLGLYPTGDYPCRQDFYRYSNQQRMKLWQNTVDQSHLLEKELALCLECDDLSRIAEII